MKIYIIESDKKTIHNLDVENVMNDLKQYLVSSTIKTDIITPSGTYFLYNNEKQEQLYEYNKEMISPLCVNNYLNHYNLLIDISDISLINDCSDNAIFHKQIKIPITIFYYKLNQHTDLYFVIEMQSMNVLNTYNIINSFYFELKIPKYKYLSQIISNDKSIISKINERKIQNDISFFLNLINSSSHFPLPTSLIIDQ